jgi:hypothetical protein
MRKHALESERVREGLKDVLLGPAHLYEALRERGEATPGIGQNILAQKFEAISMRPRVGFPPEAMCNL